MACCLVLRRISNIRLSLEGDKSAFKQKGNFVISNHLSYLDGVILGSLLPLIFVSKSEVASWRMFGWMARLGGTVFINRRRPLLSRDYVDEISRLLESGVNVLVFPEGTSTNGEGVLAFQPVFFQAPLASQAYVLALTVSYAKANGKAVGTANRDDVLWYGQTKILAHMLRALKTRQIEARIVIHPRARATASSQGHSQDRKALSESLRQVIAADYTPLK